MCDFVVVFFSEAPSCETLPFTIEIRIEDLNCLQQVVRNDDLSEFVRISEFEILVTYSTESVICVLFS